LPAERGILGTEAADQLLILLNVILHRPHLVFLQTAFARNEVAFRIALATGYEERRECDR
jgi:hypothetical protein